MSAPTLVELLVEARRLHKAGDLEQAEAHYRRILAQDPRHADAHHLLGLVYSMRHNHTEAVRWISRAIALDETNPAYHHNLAEMWRMLRRPRQAISSYRRALALRPDFAQAHYALANLLAGQGQVAEAIVHYRQVIQLKPGHSHALSNLGTLLYQQGQVEAALTCYRQAVTSDPHFFQAHHNLANVLRAQGYLAEAITHYQQAVRLKPKDAEALNNLGTALYEQGRLDQAQVYYERAIQAKPTFGEAHNNLGGLWKVQNKLPQALACYQQAIQAQPDLVIAHKNLGMVLEEQGQFAAARQAFRQALTLDPDNRLLSLRLDTMCPPILASNEEIDQYRAGLETALERYTGRDLRLDLSQLQVSQAEPPLHLAYQGRLDNPLKVKYAALFKDYFPTEPRRVNSGRPHVGFVVTHTHEGIFLRCMGGILNRLSSEKFRLTLVCSGLGGAQLLRSGLTNPAVQYLPLPVRFDQAVEQMKAAAFDLLYYWEVGTDSTNYFLPFCRLAPVQCTGWGWPMSSATPQMDYYISSELLTTPESDTHYTETLVRLPGLPPYYDRPPIPHQLRPRTHFGLPPDQPLYLCTQNLRKVHPDFDPILADILHRDPRGVVAFVADKQPAITNLLRQRWQVTLPDVADRIQLLPRLTPRDYFNIVALADVVLDTLHFGGANTTYDALAAGTPIVTLPTPLQRGRYTYGVYRRMGVLDCVGDTPAAYTEIALRLGTNPAYRAEISQKIQAACPVLFEDLAAVRELETFFEEALAKARLSFK